MRKRMLTLLLFPLLALAVGSVLLNTQRPVQGRSPEPRDHSSRYVHPFESIDEKARAARGNDEIAVRALADEIFNSVVPQEIPAQIKAAMADRLLQAEMKYRRGKPGGVSEVGVVKMVNVFTDELALPAYMKTNLEQVRFVRVSMLTRLPHFIAQADLNGKAAGKEKGRSMTRAMSPLEGAFVASFLLQQTMSNDAYQVSAREWKANIKQKRVERLRDHQAGGEPGQGERRLQLRGANPRRDEVERALSRAAGPMGEGDLSRLAGKALDALGIER